MNNDWESFVRCVAEEIDAGATPSSISSKFSGEEVFWAGTIMANESSDTDDPGIRLDMPLVEVPLNSGQILQASYLFLRINPSGVPLWAKKKDGELVSFRGKICRGGGLFPSVDFSAEDGALEVTLMPKVECGVPDPPLQHNA